LSLFGLLVLAASAKPQKSVEDHIVRNEKPGNPSDTVLEWPFFAQNDQYYLRTPLGTPAQTVNVSMFYMHRSYDLRIKVKNLGGDFDQQVSSSYYRQGRAYNEEGSVIGDTALETFQIGKKTVANMPFQATSTDQNVYNNYIGFGLPNTDSFMETTLKSLLDKTITFAFDNYPNTGVLTLGGTDTARCYNDWRIIKETFFGVSGQWGASIDTLSVGKYSFSKPGNVLFHIYDVSLRWPKTIYYSLIKGLGSTDDKTVPCNTQINITFQLGDVIFELTPEEYLDRSMEKSKGVCLLAGSTVDESTEYVLPRSILKDYCLSVNHYTKEIGLATRQ